MNYSYREACADAARFNNKLIAEHLDKIKVLTDQNILLSKLPGGADEIIQISNDDGDSWTIEKHGSTLVIDKYYETEGRRIDVKILANEIDWMSDSEYGLYPDDDFSSKYRAAVFALAGITDPKIEV